MYDYGIPNCVPEYFREKFEREEHEAELQWQRAEYYNANKEKMRKAYEAGLPVLPYGGYLNLVFDTPLYNFISKRSVSNIDVLRHQQ